MSPKSPKQSQQDEVFAALNPAAMWADLRWLIKSPALLNSSTLFPAPMLDVGLETSKISTELKAIVDSTAVETRQLALHRAIRNDSALRQHFRLGRYAECLLKWAFSQLSTGNLLVAGRTIYDQGRTLGEFDFLLGLNATEMLHLELAVKVYLAFPVDSQTCFIGPGVQDALTLKILTLKKQLSLGEHPAVLAQFDGVVADVAALVKGWIFYPADAHSSTDVLLAEDHLRGWWCRLGETIPRNAPDSQWRILEKPDWLAERDSRLERFTLDECLLICAQQSTPCMVAEYESSGRGGRELARGFIVPKDWPDRVRLSALLSRMGNAGTK